jgi:transposase
MHQVKLIEKQLTKTIALLKKQLLELEKQIQALIEKDDKLQEQYEHISETKGVGLLTFAVLVAETGGFYLIENQKQLVSYAGYDVVENQSGKHTGKTKISKKGSSRLRRAMHMPALHVIQHREPGLVELYERVYDRCGIKMKAYVAVQKKLLCLIYSLWKNNTAFDRPYGRKEALGEIIA